MKKPGQGNSEGTGTVILKTFPVTYSRWTNWTQVYGATIGDVIERAICMPALVNPIILYSIAH
jgi:hypothetical protein